ncbi:MAG: signal peptide peptidase SppA, partial [Pseudomonadota bacterium]
RAGGGVASGGGDAVGIVYVAGNIIDGTAPAGTAGGATISKLIEDAVANDDIKALVLRVDSGGGSALASEEIRQALLVAKSEGLPVVASLGPVAASGGYWVATGADTIVAQPSTITGSIGVFAVVPTFERALTELGIGTDGVKSTPYSGAPDLLGGFNSETRAFLQLGVEDIYRRFLSIVSDARDMPVARVDEVGQGRVWSGGAARQLGLVDRFGSLDDAVAVAEEAAGFDAGTLRRVDVETPPPLAVRILKRFTTTEAPAAARGGADLAVQRARFAASAAAANALAVADGPTLQARCLSCDTLVPGAFTAPTVDGGQFAAFVRAFIK